MSCHTSILKTAGLLLLGIAMCLAAYFMIANASGLMIYFGWFALTFFALCTLAIAVQLVRRKPSVIIDARGIQLARGGHRPIAWDQVESVAIGSMNGQRFLCIALHDEAAYVARLPRARQWLIKANRSMGFPAVTISFNGLTPGLDAAYAYIQTIFRNPQPAIHAHPGA